MCSVLTGLNAMPEYIMAYDIKQLEAKYGLKDAARIGPGPEDDKEGAALNRMVRWTDRGLEYEVDPRQAEKLLQELGLRNSRFLTTPGVKHIMEQIQSDIDIPDTRIGIMRSAWGPASLCQKDAP